MSDPRLVLARPGLAAAALEGVVAADRYARTRTLECREPWAAVRRAPQDQAEQRDQLLFGERLEVLEEKDGWAFGQSRRDGYVGWTRTEALGPLARAPTHWVCVRAALAFAEPDIKSPPAGPYAMNSLVGVEATDGRFMHAAGCGWFVDRQLARIGESFDDVAGVPMRFLGAPYLWGGRGSWGIDCSGLVQQALFACGRACPRDADQQMGLGRPAKRGELVRGDLAFWPGHVAMMIDETSLIHATVHHMATAIEPLAAAIERISAESGDQPTGFRRLVV
jgi:hypothetical protein